MSSQSSVFCKCDACGTDIRYGDIIVEFCLPLEEIEETSGRLVIDTLQSGLLLILCGPCGDCIGDLNEIRRHLQSSMHLPLHAVKSFNTGNYAAENQGICKGCGAVLGIADVRYSAIRTRGVIAWIPFLKITELSVTDEVEISSYCLDCGSLIDRDHLQTLLLDWIISHQTERLR